MHPTARLLGALPHLDSHETPRMPIPTANATLHSTSLGSTRRCKGTNKNQADARRLEEGNGREEGTAKSSEREALAQIC